MTVAAELRERGAGFFSRPLRKLADATADAVEKALDRLPADWQEAVSARLQKRWDADGYYSERIEAVNHEAVTISRKVNAAGLAMSADDNAIREQAAAKAKAVRFAMDKALTRSGGDMGAAYESAANICAMFGVAPPEIKDDSLQALFGALERVKCARWWRRALRRAHVRWVEGEAIKSGMVRRGRATYVTATTLARRKGQRTRNEQMLSALVAVCDETGERIDMASVAAGSMANPAMRRIETMVRLRGMDDWSIEQGHAAQFWTITAPAMYHACTTVNGWPVDNPKFIGATPDETQKYLCEVWECIRSKLDREGITIYGFRVVEPHHDATPHWHMLVFGDEAELELAQGIARQYALRLFPDERGAASHRFTAERIDRAKGSAVGYVAKYIAKHLDGEGMEGKKDEAGLRMAEAIERVDAWRSCWGIRQFQFFGTAAVTVWRELRRMKEAPDGPLESIWKAAQSEAYGGGEAGADWRAFMDAMDACPVSLWTETDRYGGAYGDDIERIKGLECAGHQYETRAKLWRFEFLPGSAGPWSPVNNCTRRVQEEAGRKSIHPPPEASP